MIIMIWIYCKKPVDYIESLNTMENLVNSFISGSIKENIVLSLQHNDVYTAGSSAKDSDLLNNKVFDIPVVRVSRGGQFTYHGLGQLVCYFILNLSSMSLDIKRYINLLQCMIISMLYEFGINAFAINGEVGVFVDKDNSLKNDNLKGHNFKNPDIADIESYGINYDIRNYDIRSRGIESDNGKSIKKIASIGVKIRKYITYHGISINCNTDLKKLSGIRPCGMDSDSQTSIFDLGIDAEICQINEILRKEFYKLFI